MIFGRISIACALGAALLTSADAAPTPVPGGANGLVALAGKTGETVFNGVLRIKILQLRDATDEEAKSSSAPGFSADQKLMYVEALLNNGSHETFTDLLTYTVADKDAITVQVPSYLIKHANPSILQGAALKQSALFAVDKDFVPAKLIVACASCSPGQHFRPVRFTVAGP